VGKRKLAGAVAVMVKAAEENEDQSFESTIHARDEAD
jgi:hypothetical protein